MTKLYYSPTSCGAASFIAAVAAGIKIETEQVDLKTHLTSSGADFYTINPKGNVPALILEDGTILNEGAAILQYIADQAPGTIAPAYGTSERYQVQGLMNFFASEVHPLHSALFMGAAGDAREAALTKIYAKFEYITKHVLKGDYLVDDKFTVADAHLYVILSWHPYVGVDLTTNPAIKSYYEFIGALPAVVKANAAMATNPSST